MSRIESPNLRSAGGVVPQAPGTGKAAVDPKAVKSPKAVVVADGVDGAALPVAPKAAARRGELSSVAGKNPFAALAAGAPVSLLERAIGSPVAMTQDVSLPPAVMEKLSAVERGALGAGSGEVVSGAASKVRQGLMLSLSDAVESHVAESGVSRDLVSHLGEALCAAKSERQAMESVSMAFLAKKQAFPASFDVNAFVQAVLRESYLLQTEILRDFAERTKRYNEIRREIRKKISDARQFMNVHKDDPNVTFAFPRFDPKKSEWVEWQVPAVEGDEAQAGGQGGGGTAETSGAGQDGLGGEGSPSLDAVPLTSEAAGMFAPAPVVTQSTHLSATCAKMATQADPVDKFHTLLSDQFYYDGSNWYVNGKKWGPANPPDDGYIFKETTGHRWGLSPEKMKLLREDFCKLSASEAVEVVNTLSARLGGKWNDEVAGLLEQILPTATTAQLLELQKSPGYTSVPVSMRQDAEARLNEAKQYFGAELSDPDLAPLVARFVDAGGNETALAELQGQLWGASPATVRRFFSAIHRADEQGADVSVFRDIFASCDGRRVFDGQAPADWEWLRGMGGAPADFHAAWVGSPITAMESAAVQELAEVASQVGSLGQDTTGMARRASGPDTSAEANYELRYELPKRSQAGMEGAPEGTSSATETAAPSAADPAGHTTIAAREVANDQETFDAYIKDLEESLATVGEDAQMANLELQDALQKQQQTIQMISNISKMLHDTAMSIIRKIGG